MRATDRTRSLVAIAENGGRFRVMIRLVSDDRRRSMICDWEGRGSELVNGVVIYDLRYRAWVDPSSNHLRVECHGKARKPERKDMHYIEEYVLAPGGLSLSVFTLERDDHVYDAGNRPRREFTKVADNVAPPPPETTP
jgi:hypothetical protein